MEARQPRHRPARPHLIPTLPGPTARLLVSNVIFPSGKLNINPDSKYGHVLVAATNTIQSVANGYGLLSSKFYDSQLVPKFE